eukprot:evm.model.NODE_2419_length_6382_cov_53.094326.1
MLATSSIALKRSPGKYWEARVAGITAGVMRIHELHLLMCRYTGIHKIRISGSHRIVLTTVAIVLVVALSKLPTDPAPDSGRAARPWQLVPLEE